MTVALAACAGEITGEETTDGDGGALGSPDAGGPCKTTCEGCCFDGVCFNPGNQPMACGFRGADCKVCRTGTACTSAGICGASSDPCNGVSTAGRCVTSTHVEVCVASTGSEPPKVDSYDCAAGETCQVKSGIAGCVQTASCSEGATDCVSGTQIRKCTGGQWVTTTCAGTCVESPLGDACGSSSGTRMFSGKVVYQRRSPNSGRSDWGPLTDATAAGFTVASVHTSGGVSTFLDSTTTGDQGNFTVLVPTSPTASDFVIVYASGSGAAGSLAFVVADPHLAGSSTSYELGTTISSPSVWSWSWRVDALTDGQTMRITDAAGSGAARIFDYLRFIVGQSDSRWSGASKDPVIVWLGMGVEWSCGACQWPVATNRFGKRYEAQIFIGGGDDEAYWADAVTAHEIGHWIMFTFGRSVGEGGRHCFGVVSAPGLAWSEGFATWFSSDVRDDSLYLDKQNGTMLWMDLGTRSTSGSSWPRAQASRGLMQDMYENEVSAMLWKLSKTGGLGHAPLDRALATSRMTLSPFERGYTRQTWETDDHTCVRTNIEDTGESTTFLADFLDALRCGGVTRAAIDAVTEPATRYPYPSGSPLCR